MKKLVIALSASLLIGGIIFANGTQTRPAETPLTAINLAQKRGEITKKEAAIYKVNLLIDSRKNPAKFQVEGYLRLKCGLPLHRQIQDDWDLLDPQVQAKITDIQNRPSKQYTYDTPEGHFKLHYDTDGSEAVYQPTVDNNSNSIPDYVERVGNYFEASWSFLDSLGFDQVPSDGTLGGDSRYDIYLQSYSGAYGVTFPEGSASEYPSRNARYSHINIDPDFYGFPNTPDENAQVTAVHEFFHAVQFAYDVSESSWLMETSSTWVEDEKYTAVNDYINYLSSVFNSPYLSITSTSGVHEYGNCVWLHHMTESKSEDLVRQIWEGCISSSALSAINNTLNNFDPASSLDEDFNDYALWNYFTGAQRGNTNMPTYDEASLFPQVSIYRYENDYPVEDASVASSVYPQGYGANYIRFSPSSNPKQNLLLLLHGNGNANMHYQLVAGAGGTYSLVTSEDGDENGDATFFVPSWPSKDEVILITSVNQNTSSGQSYTYSAMETDYAVYYENFVVLDDISGNDNGQIEPGETASISATFTNYGQALSDLEWALSTADSNITLIDSIANYSTFASGETLSNDDQKFSFEVSADAIPHLAELVVTLSDGSNTVAQQTIKILVGYPKTLLVDDQNGDDGAAIQAALDAEGIVYDHRVRDEAGLENIQFALRNTIIWTTGETYIDPLTLEERDSLKTFLDNGGHLILFGNKVLFNSGNSEFFNDYLGIEADGFASSAFMSGVANDPIAQGNYLGLASTQYPDDMMLLRDNPYVSTVWKFAVEHKPGMIKVNNGNFKVVFGSIPFGSITSDNPAFITSNEVMQNIVSWVADSTNNIPPIPQVYEPQNDALVVLTQPEEETVSFRWHESNDIDGDPVQYIFQLDTTSTFSHPNVVFKRDYADSMLTISGGKLDSLISSLGDTLQLYWRVFASDYSDLSDAPVMTFSLTTDTTGTGTRDELAFVPDAYKLYRNYPNPFNPTTTIQYDMPQSGFVNITVYDMLGNVVQTLVNGVQSSGHYPIQWNGKNRNGQKVSSGIYFVQMRTGDYLSTHKMTLLR